jgi:hypothetical protein
VGGHVVVLARVFREDRSPYSSLPEVYILVKEEADTGMVLFGAKFRERGGQAKLSFCC